MQLRHHSRLHTTHIGDTAKLQVLVKREHFTLRHYRTSIRPLLSRVVDIADIPNPQKTHRKRHRESDKMRRWRNMYQMKEQNRSKRAK